MANARLKIEILDLPGQDVKLSGLVSIGRAKDNTICIDDYGVSRYHAVIEERPGGYWLSDLGSINGTEVNGVKISEEYRLHEGDMISFGDAGRLEFHTNGTRPAEKSADPGIAKAPDTRAVVEEPVKVQTDQGLSQGTEKKGISPKLIIGAVAIGLLITTGVALLIFRSSRTEPAARIISPQPGTTIRGSVSIQVEVGKARDIERISYQLDGAEFESAEFPPYTVTLDPDRLKKKMSGLKDGNHILSVTIEDRRGNKKLQPEVVLIALDIGPKETADSTNDRSGNGTEGDLGLGGDTVSGSVDISALTQSLAGQISQKSGYKFDREFTDQIRLHTDEFRINVIDDARRYRREIIKAFRDKGLHPLLGFVLAMSQSRFREEGSSSRGSGIWRLSPQIAKGYLAPGETEEAVGDPKRSAEIAAAYMKDLINVFGMDNFMFAIACYGMPISQAGQIRAQLVQVSPVMDSQGDFWKIVKSGAISRDGADRVVRFFAAGIVGENPGAFGMKTERLSSLY